MCSRSGRSALPFHGTSVSVQFHSSLAQSKIVAQLRLSIRFGSSATIHSVTREPSSRPVGLTETLYLCLVLLAVCQHHPVLCVSDLQPQERRYWVTKRKCQSPKCGRKC